MNQSRQSIDILIRRIMDTVPHNHNPWPIVVYTVLFINLPVIYDIPGYLNRSD